MTSKLVQIIKLKIVIHILGKNTIFRIFNAYFSRKYLETTKLRKFGFKF